VCELQLDVAGWMHLIAACSPDWFESLCDSDTHRHSSRQRVRRAVDRTVAYLDACIHMQATMPVSRSVSVSASAGRCANSQHQTDNHANTSSVDFYRPDALPDAQPTVSKHWSQQIIDNMKSVHL